MIDLHSHILPGIDDGATDLATSLAMARLAVADGITQVVCTPHIVPGLYENTRRSIDAAVTEFRRALILNRIPLRVMTGADVHVAPDLPSQFAAGDVPTLNGSRYFLFEPPHRVLPPRLEELAVRLLEAGLVPIVTHPERLSWIETRYDVIVNLNRRGCMIQITADSVTGEFGRTALYYAEKLLDEGRVDILATDAHGIDRRKPVLSRSRDIVAMRLGEKEAEEMVSTRPAAIVADRSLTPVADARPAKPDRREANRGMFARLFKGSDT
jgi:protein-tyrosine phosphatase